MTGHLHLSDIVGRRPAGLNVLRSSPLVRFDTTHRPLHKGAASRRRHCSNATRGPTEYDVSRTVIQPSYRSTPWEHGQELDPKSKLRILFVSESNVCRSVLAEAIFSNLLTESGLASLVECESKVQPPPLPVSQIHEKRWPSQATRDYSLGEGPDRAVMGAAEKLTIILPEEFTARVLEYEKDIVRYDLFLVMDKFTAADVLREVSIYDTVQKEIQYTKKVRLLGEFHPQLRKNEEPDGQDIDDPLYGNFGDAISLVEVEKVAKVIEAACLGLLAYLQQVEDGSEGEPEAFRKMVIADVAGRDSMDWLVPPMFQPRDATP